MKAAVVTGASRGIGRSIALKLANEGYAVVINYPFATGEEDEVLKRITENGGQAMTFEADVSKAEEVKAMIDKTYETYGNISALVNNAGITKDNLILRMKDEEWDDVININLKGAFNTIRYAAKYMLKQRYGKIVNISSIVGVAGNAGQANYSASKAGIIGLTKSAAKELASRGINVNAVAPGFIDTNMTKVLKDEVKNKLIENIPLNRLGKPEDVADLIGFLCSDASSYITGQVIGIDGGMSV